MRFAACERPASAKMRVRHEATFEPDVAGGDTVVRAQAGQTSIAGSPGRGVAAVPGGRYARPA
jgi:hypothetical protein